MDSCRWFHEAVSGGCRFWAGLDLGTPCEPILPLDYATCPLSPSNFCVELGKIPKSCMGQIKKKHLKKPMVSERKSICEPSTSDRHKLGILPTISDFSQKIGTLSVLRQKETYSNHPLKQRFDELHQPLLPLPCTSTKPHCLEDGEECGAYVWRKELLTWWHDVIELFRKNILGMGWYQPPFSWRIFCSASPQGNRRSETRHPCLVTKTNPKNKSRLGWSPM